VIHRIESPGDPRLAPYRRVGDPGWLRDAGLFVAEGRLVVQRLIGSGRYPVHSVLVTPPAFDALESCLAPLTADVYVCPQQLVNGITGFNFHRGCLALAQRPGPASVDVLTGAARLLGLEGVGNPDNVGGLFRAAAAFGAGGVVLDRASGDPLYRKAIRTSMGATLQIPFAAVDAWPASIPVFRRAGWTIVALTPTEPSLALGDLAGAIPPGTRPLLLAGAEGPGLSAGTLAAADLRVRIPIAPGVDSLNVVVAAGVALHALYSPLCTDSLPRR
jgi:tRNA G18 (ribose-2'-O)-methylase SpoU